MEDTEYKWRMVVEDIKGDITEYLFEDEAACNSVYEDTLRHPEDAMVISTHRIGE